MSLTLPRAYSAAISYGQSSSKTELRLRDRLQTLPEGKTELLDLALEAAAHGDRHRLAKMYKLSLLAEQNSGTDSFRAALSNSLLTTHESAKQCYRDGNASEALERLRLFFNMVVQLNKNDYLQNTDEVDEWLAAAKILALPKEDCIGALNDYGFLLNCSGQYSLAIPVLKAVIREAPDRAVAYLSLGDAEYYSGNRAQANSDYETYRRLKSEHKYTGLSNACLTPVQSNGLNVNPPNTDPLQQDTIAVLSTKGRLIEPGKTTASKPEIAAALSRQMQSTNLRPMGDLPWVEDFYRDGGKAKSQIALTDATTPHSKPIHQSTRHGVQPSALQQCMDLNYEAILALQDRQPKDAIMTLNQAMEVDPGCLLTLENLAVAFNNMAIDTCNQPKAALKAFHQALALAPASAIVRDNTNAMLMRMGKDPSSFKTRLAMARECLERADYLGALVEYREAQRLQSDPQVKDMIAAVSQQLAVDELLPQPQLSASLDWKQTVEAGRLARSILRPNP
jgi:Flp pilus assembly protein TadD